jgi:small GTP-binding protein domain
MSAVRQFNNPDDANFTADGRLRIALAGNPNCGKTTVFNGYTGARQHVGNYPGVTVDRKEGNIAVDGTTVTLVDLPGTYSLTAYSMEELVSRRELAARNVQAVIDVVDASALERNMLLTVQMLEMGAPVVLCCNMRDYIKARLAEAARKAAKE